MAALILDTRALEVLADTRADAAASRRMLNILSSASRAGMPVRVPSAVLAEAYTGTSADAAVDRVLGAGMRAVTTGRRIARVAASLKYRDHLDSCDTVDALVVATAVRFGGGVIATGDPADMQSLAREHPNVAVARLTGRR